MKAKRNSGYRSSSETNSSISLLKGRYEILSYLGSGGFGNTFLARDVDLPSRQKCVVKVLKISDKPDAAHFIKRSFVKEAETLERLSKECEHRIPELYAYFVQNGNYYIVQEYVEGLTITNLMKVKTLQEVEVVNLLIELLRTLRYLHSNQVVHRDIKPDNIIIRNHDSLPVLIDFGAVKQFLVSDAEVTKSATIAIGTPGFVPWEQMSGNPTYASDIYALGMTAVFMLSGKIPHQNIAQEWHHDITVSDWLVEVINQAIALDLNERFQSAQDMLDALRGKQSGSEPIKTHKYPSPKRRQLVLNTEKLLAGMVALAIAVPVIFAVTAFNQISSPNHRNIDMGVMKQDFLK